MPTDHFPPDESFAAIYDGLRRLAAAALVHEAYLRLGGAGGFEGRSHYVRAAAEAMRRILVDHARKKRADRRGGTGKRFELTAGDRVVEADPDTVLAVDEALTRLAAEDPASADVARLGLFAGPSVGAAADALGDRVPRPGVRPGLAHDRPVVTDPRAARLTPRSRSRP